MGHLSRCFGLVLCLSLTAFPGLAGNQSADQLQHQLQERLAGVGSLHTSFVQITVDSSSEMVQSSEGELWLLSDDELAKFRIQTKTPFEQVLVSNGVDFWSYDADLEQVVVSPLQKDVTRVPILLLGNSDEALLTNYQLSFYEDDDTQHFVLEPRLTDSLFELLTIVFDAEIPVEISLRDSLGQQTKIRFIGPEIDAEIPDGTFDFQVPAGIDLIDDRQSAIDESAIDN
ncbi:MAG: outer membrane lipoprotein chaperone LolA [bacterium]